MKANQTDQQASEFGFENLFPFAKWTKKDAKWIRIKAVI